MTSTLPLDVTVDNSRGLRETADDPAAHVRTITLLIDRRGDRSGFNITAIGNPFPATGGSFTGYLGLSHNDVHSGISELRQVWLRMLSYQDPDDIRRRRFPFNDTVDLRAESETHREGYDESMLRLARAGYTLFRTVFYSGDRMLADIGDRIAHALRNSPQVITVVSEDLFIPWPMLYVPSDPDTDLDLETAPWSLQNFWGYGHLIEHSFKRIPGWSERLPFIDRVAAGLNVDRTLDTQFKANPTVKPVVDLFAAAARTEVRERRSELASAIKSADFRDQIIYFGCHGVVSGGPEAGTALAHLTLTDQDPINTNDFRSWLQQSPLKISPVVFVNACEGGQMSSLFFTSFGKVILEYGANCLVGPQIDIPPAFAKAYACEFFSRALAPKTQLGDVTQDLTRYFIERYANPLGLAYSLYRGLDSYFSPDAA